MNDMADGGPATASALSISRMLEAAARDQAEAIAVNSEGAELSWQTLSLTVRQMAGALAEAGVAAGDRVAVMAPNSATMFALLAAIPWAGAIFVPLNLRLSVRELVDTVQDTDAKLMLVADPLAETGQQVAEAVGADTRMLTFSELERAAVVAPALPDQGRANDDIAVLCYTGGTTGRAKGVMLSHRGIVTSCLQQSAVLQLGRDDRVLLVAPLFHLAGLMNAYGVYMSRGRAVLASAFDPDQVLETISREGVSYTVMVPAMIDALTRTSAIEGADLKSLKKISYGGAPMAAASLKRALDCFPTTQFVQVYGQTESSLSTALLPEYHKPEGAHLGSAGRAIAGVDLRIEGAEGKPGVLGEICLRSPSLASGYWQRPEETAETFRDGWLHTGDIGYLDTGGFLYVVDRLKDMIISGGENVYSVEVENILADHQDIHECAVIGVPSEQWGESVHAVVALMAGSVATEADIIEHCRANLAAFKCPRSVTFTTEPLPRTAIGKVAKRVLRESLAEAPPQSMGEAGPR